MLTLQQHGKRVHESTALYADTNSNFTIPHEERLRLKMEADELKRVFEVTTSSPELQVIHLLTTKHYFYGMLIADAFRRIKHRQVNALEADQTNEILHQVSDRSHMPKIELN